MICKIGCQYKICFLLHLVNHALSPWYPYCYMFGQYLSNACDIHYIFLRYRIYLHVADNHERSNIFTAIRHIKHQYSIRRLVSSFKNLYIYQFMCHLLPGLTSIEEAAKNTDGSQTKLRLLHESMDTGGWGGGNFTVRKRLDI